MWPELRQETTLQLNLLRTAFKSFGPLVKEMETREPTPVELAAPGGFLHSLYTGMENIFKRVAIAVDGHVPRGEDWHQALLTAMAEPNRRRPPVISHSLKAGPYAYLKLRHVFRQGYRHQLKWDRMSPLVREAEVTFRRFRKELNAFLTAIKA